MTVTHKIVITIREDLDNIGLEVEVPGTLRTPEAIGYMYMATQQHLQSKHRIDLCVSMGQTPACTCEGSPPWNNPDCKVCGQTNTESTP